MNPRSAPWNVRINEPRSITLATRSSPWEILILSTTVSIAGKVLSTRSVRTPGSNGVYRFGSNVSVCAMPPAIHSTMMESAVASGPAARTSCGSRPASAASGLPPSRPYP